LKGKITRLPSSDGKDLATRLTPVTHRMREVTTHLAEDGIWDSSLTEEVRQLFDSLAEEWTATRDHPQRNLPILDALNRGKVKGQIALELGAGTCISARDLISKFDSFIAMDLSLAMLNNAIENAPPLVCTDGSALPVANGAIDVLILQNMFLFPKEVERCLSTEGYLVWVNSRGPETPIHLPVEKVVHSLESAAGHGWDAVASTSGEATWAVIQRSKVID